MLHKTGGTIREGDTVVLSLGCFKVLKAKMRHGTVMQTKYGAVRHSDLIDKRPFGCKLDCARGYVHVLSASPELWTVSLEHRTQIVYTPDAALVVERLELRPGSRVVEAGTGSASLSHSLLRSIAPHGHLHTFDFHEQRSRLAEAELLDHGYGPDLVTCRHRDVCASGFFDDADNHGKVDAVFLDLPCPWKAVRFAQPILVAGGRLAVFSPCIEQIQQTAATVRQLGFAHVRVLECLQQRYTVKECRVPTTVLSRPQQQQQQQQEQQRKMTDGDEQQQRGHAEEDMGPSRRKKAKTTKKNEQEEDEDEEEEEEEGGGGGNFYSCVLPVMPTPGHTGYLLFGTLFSTNNTATR